MMSPLLVHASNQSKQATDRRTIHREACSPRIPSFFPVITMSKVLR